VSLDSNPEKYYNYFSFKWYIIGYGAEQGGIAYFTAYMYNGPLVKTTLEEIIVNTF